MNAPLAPGRRQFIGSSLALGAWVVGLGWGMPSGEVQAQAQAQTGTAAPVSPFQFYLKFHEDGTLTAFTSVTNLGQGTHTAITQMVMEELALPAERIRIAHAPVVAAFHQNMPPGITTFGSAGFMVARRTVAPACAAAREMLIAAAAQAWQVPAMECTVADGQVLHPASQRSQPYTALYAAAALLPPPQTPQVKSPKEWKVLGTSLARTDLPARTDGSAVFGIDVRLPGMLYAAVLHAPRFGERLIDVESRAALRVKGVRKVVRLDAAVAVIADSYWTAQQAVRLLRPRWQASARLVPDSEAMRAALQEAVRAGAGQPIPIARVQHPAQVAAALLGAAMVIDQEFEAPFLAHACMEPLNATVEVSRRGAQIWVSTQSQTDTQRGVAAVLNLTPEQVTVHSQEVGGGFGRRLEHDFVLEAALIAREAGAPVKTIWSREQDTRAGYYRPMTTARLRLALDAQGLPAGLRSDIASPSLLAHSRVTNSPPIEGFDWSVGMGLTDNSYAIPYYDTRWSRLEFGVPCGYWRSVGCSQNTHFVEHCLELAARACGQDGLVYRRRLLQANAPALAFIDAFAAKAGWDAPLAPGHFRGFAMNGLRQRLFSAHIVEVVVTGPGKFRLVRIAAAIDPGVAGNPAAVAAQMQSGTLFGLSAALFGEVSFEQGKVVQGNFDTYRVVTLAQTPPIEVFVLPNGSEPQGVGEEGPPSIIGALANALLAAGGQPVTRLPLSRSGWTLDS